MLNSIGPTPIDCPCRWQVCLAEPPWLGGSLGRIELMFKHHLPKRVGMPVMHHVETAVHVHTYGRPLCVRMGQSHTRSSIIPTWHHTHRCLTQKFRQNEGYATDHERSLQETAPRNSARPGQGDAGRPVQGGREGGRSSLLLRSAWLSSSDAIHPVIVPGL